MKKTKETKARAARPAGAKVKTGVRAGAQTVHLKLKIEVY